MKSIWRDGSLRWPPSCSLQAPTQQALNLRALSPGMKAVAVVKKPNSLNILGLGIQDSNIGMLTTDRERTEARVWCMVFDSMTH